MKDSNIWEEVILIAVFMLTIISLAFFARHTMGAT